MHLLSRRRFLFATGATALGAIAAACSRGNGNGAVPGSLRELTEGKRQSVQVFNANFETFPGVPERVVFGLRDPDTGDFLGGGSARVWAAVRPEDEPIGPFSAVFHGEGLGDRGVYVARIAFPTEGSWIMVVEAEPDGVSEPLYGVAGQQVGQQTQMPRAGDEAISVATPTFDDPRGVDPICTLTDGPCSMHAISLDDALATDRPTVLILATPAYCSSALCGPEVEILDELSTEFGERGNFVHIELLKDNETETVERWAQAPNPSLFSPGATAWRVTQEPAIYFIDAAGTIRQRIIGPFDKAEARETVTGLLGDDS